MRRLIVCLVLSLCAAPVFAQSGLFFSEYIEGSSNNKALEIYNGTGADLNLAGYQVQMHFNGNPNPGLTITLSGVVVAGDVFVLAQSSANPTILAQADQVNGAGWFNGDDAVVLRNASGIIDSIGQVGADPGSQWGSGLTSTADNTLRRKAGIVTGDTNSSDPFNPSDEWDGFATDTFDGLGSHGAAPPPPPPPPPPPTTAEIFEIQGSGIASPFAGQVVETFDNIVTALGTNGFFMQTPDYRADASTATSNGIFVFTGGTPTVAVGDQVDVSGRVVEFFKFTEFSGSVIVTVDASSQPLPAYVAITPGYADFEALEGMLVRVTNGRAITGTDRFNETVIVADADRPFRQPGIDGGTSTAVFFEVDPTGLGGAAQQIVGGASIDLAEGPLSFDFGNYSIWTTTLEFTNPPFPRALRTRNAGEMLVAAQNLLRLFDRQDNRLPGVSQYIREILGAPDVLAVSEVENLQTLVDLAAQLNADEGGLNYTAYLLEGHDPGGIDVGFLVRATVRVDAVQQLGADDMWIDPQDGQLDFINDRPPLLLRGEFIGNGAPFPVGVIAVHQRSLIGIETSERTRQKRQLQAEKLAGYVESLQSAEPGMRLVVTGDFNAFEFDDGYVDVMGIITSGANLTNQVLAVPADDRYSYMHSRLLQVLDHSLTSAALNPFVRDAQFTRATVDAPNTFPTVSDHEGIGIFIMTDYDSDNVPDDADSCARGDARPTVVIGACDSAARNVAIEGGCTLADRLNGLRVSSSNHGAFVSSSTKLLNELKKAGVITGAEMGAIQSCIARSN